MNLTVQALEKDKTRIPSIFTKEIMHVSMKQERVDMTKNRHLECSYASPLGMSEPSDSGCIFQLTASLCYLI